MKDPDIIFIEKPIYAVGKSMKTKTKTVRKDMGIITKDFNKVRLNY